MPQRRPIPIKGLRADESNGWIAALATGGGRLFLTQSQKRYPLPDLPFNPVPTVHEQRAWRWRLLRIKRLNIYRVATCEIGWTADGIVVVEPSLYVSPEMRVLGPDPFR
ncbi:MAG: hypothetical protein IPO75_08810, partial [Betaproteobacteria bacterium]|nr:hypothetical protein [Betaproteobacteria bacterium]